MDNQGEKEYTPQRGGLTVSYSCPPDAFGRTSGAVCKQKVFWLPLPLIEWEPRRPLKTYNEAIPFR